MSPVTNLSNGDVVQLGPHCKNPMLAGCMMVVSEPMPFGAMGYVQCPGNSGKPGGAAFYRAKWEEFEYVGTAQWVIE